MPPLFTSNSLRSPRWLRANLLTGYRRLGLLTGSLCLVLAACSQEEPVASPDPEAPLPVTTQDFEAAPPSPPQSAFIAAITPEQSAQIKALDVPFVLPTAIPEGFLVEQVNVTQDERFASYQLLYRDAGDRCFVIEHTSGGIGGTPETESRVSVNPPAINDAADYGLNYGSYTAPDLRAQFPEPNLSSDWLPIATGFYRFAGAAYINNALAVTAPCENISVDEAVTVIESLALISPEIQGDSAPPE
ncbi:MAG: hypothetical protein AAF283_03505 [Cyanobacteria bacterium P01_A01_bin.70]